MYLGRYVVQFNDKNNHVHTVYARTRSEQASETRKARLAGNKNITTCVVKKDKNDSSGL